jgi:hypothetical protein
MRIEIERGDDGRVVAEIPELPGVLAYGATEAKARPIRRSCWYRRPPRRAGAVQPKHIVCHRRTHDFNTSGFSIFGSLDSAPFAK